MAKGVANISGAVAADQAGQLHEALRLYELGISSFVLVLKYERNDRVRGTLESKIKEYLDRAEAIKGVVNNKSYAPSCALPHATSPPHSSGVRMASFPSPSLSNTNNNINKPNTNNNKSLPHSISSPSLSSSSSLSPVHIKIQAGQMGCSYDSLFGRFLSGASQIEIEDPYIRTNHQIHNFTRFIEVVMKRTNSDCLVHLMTSAENPAQKAQIEVSLSQIKTSLASSSSPLFPLPHSIQLVLTFSDTLHDRSIRLNNGWVIKIGRGLDFYSKPQSKFCLGYFDLDLRPCLETQVDIFKETR